MAKKKEDDLRAEFLKSTALTTEELLMLRKNAIDNVLDRFAQKLKNIEGSLYEQIYVEDYKKSVADHEQASINSIQDVINHVNQYFDYYDVIRTQEELQVEFDRAKKFVFYQGMDLPIVVEFDYQYFNEDSISQKPTFYSYYNSETKTDFGTGAYHIAFPSTQKYLTDEEVMVAMKHEFGHIFQGHCTIAPKDDFEKRYNNQAMDISINLGMTAEEQDLLFSIARKIWKNPTACPCMSLAKATGEGGFGIPVAVSPQDWRGTNGFIRAYYEKKNKGGQQGQGKPQKGDGEGGGESQPDEKINVGDFIWVPGSSPRIYGKVTAIDDATGEVSYDEYTEEQWAQIKAQIKEDMK